MQMEFNLMSHFLHSHDFFEGIRAAVIDKDQSPHWQPSSLEAVSQEIVQAYFTSWK